MTPSENTTGQISVEERTLQFAANVAAFVKRLPRMGGAREDAQQLLRSAASIGSSYIEANEASSRTDYVSHIRRCLKEAKESAFWLRLTDTGPSDSLTEFKGTLVLESRELMRIFFAILRKIRHKSA